MYVNFSDRPNAGFLSQLELFESMGNKIDPQNQQFKLYKLSRLASQIQMGMKLLFIYFFGNSQILHIMNLFGKVRFFLVHAGVNRNSFHIKADLEM